jgi:hypothetical protein
VEEFLAARAFGMVVVVAGGTRIEAARVRPGGTRQAGHPAFTGLFAPAQRIRRGSSVDKRRRQSAGNRKDERKNQMRKAILLAAAAAMTLMSGLATAAEIEVKMLNKGEKGADGLNDMRNLISVYCQQLFEQKHPFDEDTLKWCINGLLAEDLLSDEKQGILREFLDNSLVLKEMADILNMRFEDIEKWDWDAGEEGSKSCPRMSPERRPFSSHTIANTVHSS